MASNNHPLAIDLLDYVDGDLPEDSRPVIAAHLDGCRVCRIYHIRLLQAAEVVHPDQSQLHTYLTDA